MISRRNFLRLGALGTIGAAGGAGFIAAENTAAISCNEFTIQVPGLAPEFSNYRLGVLSDPHLGVYLPNEWVERGVNLLNAARIDCLILGGDYIWATDDTEHRLYSIRNEKFSHMSADEQAEPIFYTFADLIRPIRARDGVFAVLGNHDGWMGPGVCCKALSQANVDCLVNQTHEVKRGKASLKIIGVDDYWTGIPKFPFQGIPSNPGETRVLVSHNPDYYTNIIKSAGYDFQLGIAGHTHGGQIKLPLIGALHYNITDLRFSEGLNRAGDRQIFTSRGLGVVEFPFRLNCPPEVNVLELVSA